MKLLGMSARARPTTPQDATKSCRRDAALTRVSYEASTSRLEHVMSVGLLHSARRLKIGAEPVGNPLPKKPKLADEEVESPSELSCDVMQSIIGFLKEALLASSYSTEDAKKLLENICSTNTEWKSACDSDRTWTRMFAALEDEERVYWEKQDQSAYAEQVLWEKCVDLIHRRDGYDIYHGSPRDRVIGFASRRTAWREWLPRHFKKREPFLFLEEVEAAIRDTSGVYVERYGEPEAWILSELPEQTSFEKLFASFDGPCPEDYIALGAWDMTKIINTAHMFSGCQNFNGYIGKWNMQNVGNARSMFSGCKNFNCDISGWNVDSLFWADYMFYGCSKFNQDIGKWKTPRLMYMRGMFAHCSEFSTSLNNWDVSRVVVMNGVFMYSGFNSSIDEWDVSSVVDASKMFMGSAFDQPIHSWTTKSLVEATQMFESSNFNQPLDHWCVTFLYMRGGMFNNDFFSQDLSRWLLPKLKDPSWDEELIGHRKMFSDHFNQNFKPRVESDCRSKEYIQRLAEQHQLSGWTVRFLAARAGACHE